MTEDQVLTTVCSYCKKIIKQGNSKLVSHGICLECLAKYFPEEELAKKEVL
jgi:hypothetical protein